jgi:hypothetical protein
MDNPVIHFALAFLIISALAVSIYFLIKLVNPSLESAKTWGLTLAIVLLPVTLPLALYFLPSIIAWKRKHRNFLALFVLNACLAPACGIGWLVALVWACLNEPTPVVVQGLPSS